MEETCRNTGVPVDIFVNDTNMKQKIEATENIYIVRGRKKEIQNSRQTCEDRKTSYEHQILKLESKYTQEIHRLMMKLEIQSQTFAVEGKRLTSQLTEERRAKMAVEQGLNQERNEASNLRKEIKQLKERMKAMERDLTTATLKIGVYQTSVKTLTREKREAEKEAEDCQREFIKKLHDAESQRVEVTTHQTKAEHLQEDLSVANSKIGDLHTSMIIMARVKGEAERKVKEITTKYQVAEEEIKRLKTHVMALESTNGITKES